MLTFGLLDFVRIPQLLADTEFESLFGFIIQDRNGISLIAFNC